MAVKTLIVNTMPRRSAEDAVTQEGGVVRARNSPPVEAPDSTWNPIQELDSEERVHRRMAQYHAAEETGDIPAGMEGSYYL